MPIDIEQETLVSLGEAARALPPVNGRKPHISSLWRWARCGVRGVRLEYVRLGSKIATSKEALSRFVNALAAADEPIVSTQNTSSPQMKRPSPRVREQQIQQAEAALAKDGI
jgi:hypothetical protein